MKVITLEQLMTLIKARVTEADSQQAAADAMGVSKQALWQLLNGVQREPGRKVLKGLGYKRIVMYEKL